MAEKTLESELKRCNKCGFCQEVCPVYQITKHEGDVARGRIKLARLICDGKYDWANNKGIADYINSCLLCKACVINCPSGVPADQLMIDARSRICEETGLSPIQRYAYRKVMSHRGRIDQSIKLAHFYQASGIQKLVDKTGVLNLIPRLKEKEMMFRPAFKSTGKIEKELREVEEPKYRVGYFLGCATRIFFEDVALATIRVLQKMGCSVDLPPVECCGAPHWCTGDSHEAKRLADNNIKMLLEKDYDFIVTDCGTCGAVLKEYPEWFEDDEELLPFAEQFSSKVKDINEFIVNFLNLNDLKLKPVYQLVSYHDPCHLIRGQGISSEPRTILESIPGLRFVEMKEADWCCGGAGSYSQTHAELSQEILKRKLNNFKNTCAGTLATSCPSCMLQLSFGMRKYELPVPVCIVHTIQLLDIALNGDQ